MKKERILEAIPAILMAALLLLLSSRGAYPATAQPYTGADASCVIAARR